jgi:hypothetical protein
VTIAATCGNLMDLYVNGQLLSNKVGDWEDTKRITVNAVRPTVVGINCIDQGAVLPKIRLHNSKGPTKMRAKEQSWGWIFTKEKAKFFYNCFFSTFLLQRL